MGGGCAMEGLSNENKRWNLTNDQREAGQCPREIRATLCFVTSQQSGLVLVLSCCYGFRGICHQR